DLYDYIRADWVNAGYVLYRDSFSRPLVPAPIDFFNAAVKRSWDRVPKMKECVFFEADVNKHRLQAHLDVSNLTLINAADYVSRTFTLDAVFLQLAVLEQSDAGFEFFHAEYQLVAGLSRGKPQNLFYLVYHKTEEVDHSEAQLPLHPAVMVVTRSSSCICSTPAVRRWWRR